MELSLEALGLSKEEIQERVIDTIVDRMFNDRISDENGLPVTVSTHLERRITAHILGLVEARVDAVLLKPLEEGIDKLITNFKIEHTNNYGEKKRDPETITEFVIRRAQEFLTEGVNASGKSKKEAGSDYSFAAKTTRVAYLIDQRLNADIEKAMKEALAEANTAITNGLKSAVAFELDKINAKLKS